MGDKKSKIIIFLILIGIFSVGAVFWKNPRNSFQRITPSEENNFGGPAEDLHLLSIEYMRRQSYPGSEIIIEQTLPASPAGGPSGSNYNQYIASYRSDGLKIYSFLTVPQGIKPKAGWPVIIFNHGFIPPDQYRTTERYVAYVDAFARNGYIVFKSDYRGHGNSEGKAEGGYGSNAYTIDVLNAVSSIKQLRDPTNPSTSPSATSSPKHATILGYLLATKTN
ncbi:MAG: alpha/beta hydrolase [Candidatus Levybacteria bacterium]|nr:alpha/beta hydrolase [Candidatus Levybacteria bacterium]